MYTEKDYKKSMDALNIGAGLMIAFYFIGLCLLFSCTTERKAVKYFNTHSGKAANYFASNFKIPDSIIQNTITQYDTVESAPVYVLDTTVLHDTFFVKKVPCPPTQVVTKTVTKTETVYRENTAKVVMYEKALQAAEDLIKADNKLIESQNKVIKSGKGLIFRLFLVIAALLLWIFRKPLLNLINPVKPFSL